MEQLKGEKANLVLTGGHAATTAVAVVEEIKSLGKNWKIYWIGVKNAIEGKKIVTLESEVLPKLGVKFLPLITGRIQRRFTIWTIPSLFKIPVGFVQSFYYLLKVRPNVILSFGGFASFPVVIDAKILGIPVILHEQTSRAGRSNQLSVKFAEKVALARRESLEYYPKEKSIVIGNPVMKEIAKVRIKSKVGNPPTIFITGGSRGSQSINSALEGILRVLLSRYKIIHQTGGLDYLKFSDIKQKLPQALRDNYEVFVRVNPLDIAKIYQRSDIVIARAGANTVSEIMTVKRPAILIPLPISYMDEQMKNATIAKNWGIAQILDQKSLTPETLFDSINKLIENFSRVIRRIKSKESLDAGASKKLVAIVESYVK